MHQFLRSSTLALLAAGTLSLGLTACGDGNSEKADASVDSMTQPTVDSTAMMADDARMGKSEGVMVDGVAMLPTNNIVQNAVMAPSVSTLVKAVQAAGLDGTLSGPGPFTVFAPTNAAFDKLPNGAVAGLLKPESKDKLAAVLTYHVIQGRLVAQDLKDGQELTTVNGEKLKVMIKDGVVMVGNGKDAPATVQVADVISSNGVTHVIDKVILPLTPAQ